MLHVDFHQLRRLLLRVAPLALLVSACFATPQGQIALQITSPANNTVVSPGQTVSLTVTSPNNTTFAQVFVAGDGPIKATEMTSSLPAQLSLLIPQKIALGKHFLTAVGATGTASQPQLSAQLIIDVERADIPTQLIAGPDSIFFESSQGEITPLRIQANFSDGTFYSATRSSYVSFASSNAAIAAVDSNGNVTSVAQGTTTITATYTLNSQNITVSVPVTVPPPNVTASPTSLNFTNQNVGTASPSQAVTHNECQ
jgi:hypothetical protein